MVARPAVFSSRKLEQATYDSRGVPLHRGERSAPDRDTIATFRRRFLKEIEALFVKVLLLAREMGVLKMGTLALDGTKIHANAVAAIAPCLMNTPVRSKRN